ncbi:MAG TPA: DPP IV N-terminal domain-containing protein [Candidatus Solibacter sp.]
MGDAGAALSAETPAPAPAGRRALPWMVASVLAIVAAYLAAGLWRATRPVDHPPTHLSVDLGPDAVTGFDNTVALSPDGRRIVFPVRGPDGKQQLATRLLDQSQTALLPGTGSGFDPVFSPDGQTIAFFAAGQLKKISLQGGSPLTLCNSPSPRGVAWSEDGSLVVAITQLSPLSRIPATGGVPQRITKLGAGEIGHRWPQVLPGGRVILFSASRTNTGADDSTIEALSVKTGQVKILLHGGYYGRYVPGGYLIYVKQGTLFGVRFDPDRLEVQGAPVPLVDDVAANPITGGGQFDFASGPASGALAYLAGKGAAQSLTVSWLDNTGAMQPLTSTPGLYTAPRFSPDGRQLLIVVGSDVYVHDLERNTNTQLTFGGYSVAPVWAPDGKHLVYTAVSDSFRLTWIRSNGSGQPQVLWESRNNLVPWSFPPDGSRLAYHEYNLETGGDLWTLPLDLSDPDHPKPGKPEVFLTTAAEELVPRFSPDGRWIAYRSNESGANEIYVRPFPPTRGGKWQISTGGGIYALWSKTGRELFYESADGRIMVLDYSVDGDAFVPGNPRLWSKAPVFQTGVSNLDLAPDGKRFAVLTAPEAAAYAKGSVHVTFLLNFFDELKRRMP